jgi:hypothetical protein
VEPLIDGGADEVGGNDFDGGGDFGGDAFGGAGFGELAAEMTGAAVLVIEGEPEPADAPPFTASARASAAAKR